LYLVYNLKVFITIIIDLFHPQILYCTKIILQLIAFLLSVTRSDPSYNHQWGTHLILRFAYSQTARCTVSHVP